MRALLTIVAVAALGLCTGCGGRTVLGGAPGLNVVQGDALPPPTRADSTVVARDYLIGPFDKLTVDVFGIKELSQFKVQTDGAGRFAFPLAGTIEAAGHTPTEVAGLIAGRLRGRYVRDPQVSVNLEETVSQVMAVNGEVVQPGLYPVVGNMTLIRAIATAKGTTEFAKMSDVVVFRTVNGQKMAALYNLKMIQRGAYADPDIFANDVVVVGNSEARRIFKDVLQAAPLITTPIIAYLNNRN